MLSYNPEKMFWRHHCLAAGRGMEAFTRSPVLPVCLSCLLLADMFPAATVIGKFYLCDSPARRYSELVLVSDSSFLVGCC